MKEALTKNTLYKVRKICQQRICLSVINMETHNTEPVMAHSNSLIFNT